MSRDSVLMPFYITRSIPLYLVSSFHTFTIFYHFLFLTYLIFEFMLYDVYFTFRLELDDVFRMDFQRNR
jgi:hypothetical protein